MEIFCPLMTCIEGEKARKMMEEVHSGSCGNHSGGRSLAVKIKSHRPYWPTMVKDCENFTGKCENDRSTHPLSITIPVHEMVDGHSRTHAQVKTKMILAGFDRFLLKNGSKWTPMQALKKPMSKASNEKTLSADMESHTKS